MKYEPYRDNVYCLPWVKEPLSSAEGEIAGILDYVKGCNYDHIIVIGLNMANEDDEAPEVLWHASNMTWPTTLYMINRIAHALNGIDPEDVELVVEGEYDPDDAS